MFEALSNPQMWVSLVTLTLLEIVLGVDNIVFIAILSGSLPESQQPSARRLGLAAALITRLMLLGSLAWMARHTAPLFAVLGHDVSMRDLILVLGGIFLLYKSTTEIHERMVGGDEATAGPELSKGSAGRFIGVIVQIMFLDIIFSLDSVITAVGMVKQLGVMAAAVVLAVLIMLVAVGTISRFINQYPTIKMLALAFLLLVGIALVAEGCGQPIPRGYIYFAMFFSMLVEILNIRSGRVHRRGSGA